MLHTKKGIWLGLGVTFLFILLSPLVGNDIVRLVPDVVSPKLKNCKEPQWCACYLTGAARIGFFLICVCAQKTSDVCPSHCPILLPCIIRCYLLATHSMHDYTRQANRNSFIFIFITVIMIIREIIMAIRVITVIMIIRAIMVLSEDSSLTSVKSLEDILPH